jgi:hypothetical protein
MPQVDPNQRNRTIVLEGTNTTTQIYDSQDDLHLKIYCKPEIYQNKRFNSYRFTFRLPHKDHEKATPEDYFNIDLKDKFNLHEPLLI